MSNKQTSEVVKKLTLARKVIGLSQERVAFDTGISQTHLSNIENGKKDPRLSTVMKLMEEYELEWNICARP